jgi:hypothetical protein
MCLAQRVEGGFGPAPEVKFHQHVAHVVTGSLRANEEALGYLGIGETLPQQVGYLELALRETRILFGAGTSASVENA